MVAPNNTADQGNDKPILDELFTMGGMVDGIMIDGQAPPNNSTAPPLGEDPRSTEPEIA